MANTTFPLRVALYARVSSERQAHEGTIASQLEALLRRIRDDGLCCDPELRFVDDGVSGTVLLRPGLERLRDQAAAGSLDRLYVHDPDRFSRKYAYQVLILEELARCGVEVAFLCNPPGDDPAANLLVQVQGMIAEYERAKIMERSRRGKQHAARRGSVNVLSGAPYGYRSIRKRDGYGEARYQVVAEEARVARRIFEWVGHERCTIREVTRRLKREGIATRTGLAEWDESTIARSSGTRRTGGPRPTARRASGRTSRSGCGRLRPMRGRPEFPKLPMTRIDTPAEDRILIEVPALVDEDLFAAVQEQLEENRKRSRVRARGATYLLQGLIVCRGCGYACHGTSAGGRVAYAYYRCRGSEPWRYGGQKKCRNRAIRTERLDTAVWVDVHALLSEPERVREEYRRRLEGPKEGPACEVSQLAGRINQVRRTISRLIDAYGDGLLERSKFEPRVTAARERLARLEQEHRRVADEEVMEAELRLVIGQLEEFGRRVSEGLEGADWPTRREIIRALVKRVEVDENEARIVYRVSPSPFESRPQQGLLQHCWGRSCAFSSRRRIVNSEFTATLYPGPKGNLVSNASSIFRAQGLSSPPGRIPPYSCFGRPHGPDRRVQAITSNLLARSPA